ncbi:sigma-70 family RNA polymerase sigma factor [uncultured Chryseobacterium sp.]|uniref:RNA polymerase sigma factor n=1 Tax=uncultured Chryseobacterium sp. TaxID=259322 RepID=UPI0025D500CE|nr:sigma-70 family RNA polymerase sigma factor [uncultured Chryseobacterium sp.]
MIQNTNTLNWQKIYLDYSPKLLGICRRYISDIYTAEDIVQDSFITAIQKNDQLNDEKALFAWLKKIVVNNALQHIRKHSKDTFVTTEPSEIPDTYSEMDHSLSEEKNIFIYDFTREELLSSIDSLPSHHKSVFNLYFIENHSHTEISGLLGITVNTSKSHLLRAKKTVQNHLMNNFIDQKTPKKKMAQLLVLFGFGGLLWAQTFRSKFADFKIQPSRKLEISSEIPDKISILTSNNSLSRKVIISVTLLIIILGSVFFIHPGDGFFTANNSAILSESADAVHVERNENKADKNKMAAEIHQNLTGQNKKEELSEDNGLNNTYKAQPAEKKLPSRQNPQKNIDKDSVHEIPHRVVVVKKIIKRDTIFVEK